MRSSACKQAMPDQILQGMTKLHGQVRPIDCKTSQALPLRSLRRPLPFFLEFGRLLSKRWELDQRRCSLQITYRSFSRRGNRGCCLHFQTRSAAEPLLNSIFVGAWLPRCYCAPSRADSAVCCSRRGPWLCRSGATKSPASLSASALIERRSRYLISAAAGGSAAALRSP